MTTAIGPVLREMSRNKFFSMFQVITSLPFIITFLILPTGRYVFPHMTPRNAYIESSIVNVNEMP